jgi:hypothetical protein
MTVLNPTKRLTIDEVINHKWTKGQKATKNQVIAEFELRKKILDKKSEVDKEKKRTERA